jgi:glycosyltransferase involved in cell wall biosynthesis
MKVLFIHNYSVDSDWHLWQTERKTKCPTHYLWGITHLYHYDIDVKVLPYEKYTLLKKIGYLLKLGDLDHQLRIFLGQADYDVVYSACQTGTIVLSILRVLGLFHKPLVVKLERPFRVNFLSRILLKIFFDGHDKIICLSNRVQSQLINEFEISEEKVPLLNWGPDLKYYDNEATVLLDPKEHESQFILSAGSTSRDYKTLAEASHLINYPIRIYCSESSAPKDISLPPNVSVQYRKNSTEPRALSFDELLREYIKASAVAIPLEIPKKRADITTLIGLTSLLEAMVMGKAVIMTKHRQINIDIEKEEIGIWVEPGDVNSWQRALSYLIEHPQKIKEMGVNARKLCETKFNLDLFSQELAMQLKRAVYNKD